MGIRDRPRFLRTESCSSPQILQTPASLCGVKSVVICLASRDINKFGRVLGCCAESGLSLSASHDDIVRNSGKAAMVCDAGHLRHDPTSPSHHALLMSLYIDDSDAAQLRSAP